jgi:hypothetical protein
MKTQSVRLALLVCGLLVACGGKESTTGDAGPPDSDSATGEDGTVMLPDGGPCIDIDGDGHCRGLDCDDENAAVHPSQAEVCGNAMDDNCDGEVDEGCVADTATYFVDRDSIGGTCDDSNPGTETAPWCTIDKANTTLTAGDTVYIRAGTYPGATIQPTSSGSSETTRITYSAYIGEEVTIEGSVYCIRLQGSGYMLLDDWDPRKTGMMLARWGVAIKNNIFHDNQLHAIYYYYVDEQQQDVANNWEHQGDPLFVSVSGQPDPADFLAYDFHLQGGSPCLDYGGFLTLATNAGQDSTLLQVENAGYFTDGHGVVEGDMIQLEGQTVAVVITDIDYAAQSITVSAPLTWEVGTGVGLPYLGTAPDQGVYEHAP